MKKIYPLFIACLLPYTLSAEENYKITYKLSPGAEIVSIKDLDTGSLKEGAILISPENGGSISKVISKQGEAFKTRPAAMEEAFESLDAVYSGGLKPGDVKKTEYYYEGLSLDGSKGDGKEFNLKLDNVVLYDYDGDPATLDDRIVADGDMNFLLGLDWDIKIDMNSIRELNFANNIDQKSVFDVLLSTPIRIPLPFKKEFKLMEYEFAPVIVGPVVFTTIVTVSAGFNVGVAGKVKVNINQKLSGRYGTRYLNGRWSGISETKEKSFKGFLSFLGADGWMKAYAGPQIKLNFYNTAGPYVEGFGYLKAKAYTTSFKPLTINWNLYGGLEANAGVSVKIFSFGMRDFEKTIATYETVIATGTFGGNTAREMAVPPLKLDEESMGSLTREILSRFGSGR